MKAISLPLGEWLMVCAPDVASHFCSCTDSAAPMGFRAQIRIQEVGISHPAYHLQGTENAIIVQSAFHPYPLVIQGAGEGARQAASSLLNDILQ